MYKTGNANKTNENNANLTDCLMAMVLRVMYSVHDNIEEESTWLIIRVICLQNKYNIH